jgi:hypothetical protein
VNTQFLRQTERQFQRAVVEYAQLRGWMVYHTFDSRRSNAGFPDLVLVRRGHLVVAELKSEKGRVSPDQLRWLDALGEVEHATVAHVAGLGGVVYPAVEVHVWRPSDWSWVRMVLG